MTKEQKAMETNLSRLSHVDGEGLCTKLSTDYHSLSVRISESVRLWDGYVTSHSSLEDSVVAYHSWLDKQSFKSSPPTSQESCQHALSMLKVMTYIKFVSVCKPMFEQRYIFVPSITKFDISALCAR